MLNACRWAPITDPDPTTCGIPQEYDASKEFAGKKVVLVSVPGAFTPSCSSWHIPPFIARIDELTAKGVDFVVVIASNDSWVMNAYVRRRERVTLSNRSLTFKVHDFAVGVKSTE